jgi:hypothetical protein
MKMNMISEAGIQHEFPLDLFDLKRILLGLLQGGAPGEKATVFCQSRVSRKIEKKLEQRVLLFDE